MSSSSLFIRGQWLEGHGAPMRSLNPANGKPVWDGDAASTAQVGEAVDAARSAFVSWSRLSFDERAACVREFGALTEANKTELAMCISLETGKPTWEALAEIGASVRKVDISIEAYQTRTGETRTDLAEAVSVVRHRPHGVVGVLGPYNFPVHLPNGHIVPSLLAGNTVVFKPSELTPRCAEEIVKLWEGARLPAGVLNLVQGDAAVGRALVTSSDLDGLFFTGSAATGHLLHEHFAGHPETVLALEMGGNNPLIVDTVADIDAAVYMIIQSAYITAGQRCTCARRLFVPSGGFGDRVVERLIEVVQGVRVGAFDDPEPPFMGPVISEGAADALVAAQASLQDLGGNPLVELRKIRKGTGFVSPGLIDVTAVARLPDEEYFGPLLQLIRVGDLEQAIDRANETKFGLAAGLLSDDRAHYEMFVDRIHAGIVNWNRPLTGASSGAPFGGVGASGNHRPSAYYAADYCAYPVASLEAEVARLPDALYPGVVL